MNQPCVLLVMHKRLEHRLNVLTLAVLALCLIVAWRG